MTVEPQPYWKGRIGVGLPERGAPFQARYAAQRVEPGMERAHTVADAARWPDRDSDYAGRQRRKGALQVHDAGPHRARRAAAQLRGVPQDAAEGRGREALSEVGVPSSAGLGTKTG